jgi:hypothetical protein
MAKYERAQAAEIAARTHPRKYATGFPVALRKIAHPSGANIPIHPFPTFTPLDASSLPADQVHLLTQHPKHMRVTGVSTAFTVHTQMGWTAEVTMDGNTNHYQLKVTPP